MTDKFPTPLSRMTPHARDAMALTVKNAPSRTIDVESAGIAPNSEDYRTARIMAAALINNGAPRELVKDPHVALEFLKKRGVTDINKIRPKVRNALIKDLKKEYVRLDRERKRNLDEQSRLLGQLNTKSTDVAADDVENTQIDLEQAGRALRSIADIRIERPQGSSMHHLIEFMKKSRHYTEDVRGFVRRLEEFNFQSFLVEHDWAKAFSGATDFYSGEYPLPYDNVCFEFRINGLRVLMLVGHQPKDNCHVGILVTGINGRWYVNADRFVLRGGKVESINIGIIERDRGLVEQFLNFLADQVRAVCIMLDARVAEHRRIEASERLNAARVRAGKVPARSYNVISLARRYLQRSENRSEGTGSPRQLHLRRGHWRHFDHDGGQVHYVNDGGFWVSKTWINWMLVGDPDLGFVEKHYRL